ncbi:MAG: mechanosensitive ion channel protein MscS [Kordiimonas sp.]|nr:mechanosensitive ion channel protein MscS [Kordiimonas sp.]|tara:strand:+ start:605 stop:1813 length:1209 start_codon:yes stop_codon:yes gene_type:complete
MNKTTADNFLALLKDVWQDSFFGIDVSQIISALGILLFFVLLRRLFSLFIINRLKAVALRTKNDIDDAVIDALEAPISFIPIVIGVFVATEMMMLEDDTAVIAAQNLNRSLISFNIFWALYQVVNPLSFSIGKAKDIFTPNMVDWMVKAGRALFIFLGAATILEIWGVKVAPLIAGLGLFGVAVALGAQDLFKNLIAGIFIIGERRFTSGDWILVDGLVEGTVDSIGFRTTTVRRFDKAPVYVPNAKLADSAVTNFSRMTHRRIYWKIGVTYDTSVDQLRAIREQIEAYVLGNDDFAHPPEVSTFVHIDSFNDSSIDLMLYCFTRSIKWGEWLQIKEELALAIKDIVTNAGSSFAFPSTSVYLETLPEGAEVFPLNKPAETGAKNTIAAGLSGAEFSGREDG